MNFSFCSYLFPPKSLVYSLLSTIEEQMDCSEEKGYVLQRMTHVLHFLVNPTVLILCLADLGTQGVMFVKRLKG